MIEKCKDFVCIGFGGKIRQLKCQIILHKRKQFKCRYLFLSQPDQNKDTINRQELAYT